MEPEQPPAAAPRRHLAASVFILAWLAAQLAYPFVTKFDLHPFRYQWAPLSWGMYANPNAEYQVDAVPRRSGRRARGDIVFDDEVSRGTPWSRALTQGETSAIRRIETLREVETVLRRVARKQPRRRDVRRQRRLVLPAGGTLRRAGDPDTGAALRPRVMLDSWFRAVPAYRVAAFRVVLAATTLCNYLPVLTGWLLQAAASPETTASIPWLIHVPLPVVARSPGAGVRRGSSRSCVGWLPSLAAAMPRGARRLRLRRRQPLAQRLPAPAAAGAGRLLPLTD